MKAAISLTESFMPRDKKQRVSDEALDSIGRLLIKSGSISDAEVQTIVSNPFSYQRIRSKIDAERVRREAHSLTWIAMIAAAGRAIPAMALIAAAAVGLAWFSAKNQPALKVGDIAAISPSRPGPLAPVTACSISSKSECVVSIDEVLALMIDQNGKELRK